MQIPEYFKNKMISMFGQEGQTWVEDSPQILDQCIKKWNLTNCSFIKDMSVNLVCFAESPDYGEVVLKIDGPHPEKYTEMKAMSLYKGRNMCQCYDTDMNLGALLLERIIPGCDLTVVEDTHTQLMIAAELISKLPIQVKKNHGIPTYADKINRAFKRARKENIVGGKMLSFIDEAERLFSQLENGDRPKVLLHGDLHHWNILQDQNGAWKAIDPQGVIGAACMESARFMDNHINMVEEDKKSEHLDEMIRVFSTKFGETKRTIAICLFVLCVLSTCWTFEEANPDPDDLREGIDKCEFVLNYIKTL